MSSLTADKLLLITVVQNDFSIINIFNPVIDEDFCLILSRHLICKNMSLVANINLTTHLNSLRCNKVNELNNHKSSSNEVISSL